MNPKFIERGNKLGRFIEECGEAIHAAGKCVRYGYNSFDPTLPEDKQESNERWLEREVNDLQDAINRLKKQRGWK